MLVAIFLLGRALGQVPALGIPGGSSDPFRDVHLPYALAFFVLISVAMIFAVQVNRTIGPNVLRHFVLGTYHRPRDENRVFMFLDLEGSTRLTEELGGSRYYALLRRFVDRPERSRARVARADLQVRGRRGRDHLARVGCHDRCPHCVRCYFDMTAALEARADAFRA